MEPNDDKTQTHVVLTKGTMVSHYRIVEKIGAGGMGEVYLAEDTKLNRRVALKFLPPHLSQNDDCRKRFTREAQAAASLDHPNIAAIHEVGEFQGRPFYAMQIVEGQSLKDLIAGEGLSIERILEIAMQMCEGLQAAHEKGIIHRDIKPSNILLDGRGRVRIVDFGLAAIHGSEHLTKTGSTLGTIGYMSPEQVQGKEVDHRSDLFSLGVVLYEMLTRQNPFRRDSEAATLKAVCDDTPHPAARYSADVPDRLQTIIDKALEKDVRTRYQHADGMLSDLARVKSMLESGQALTPTATSRRHSLPAWWAAALIAVAAITVLITTRPWVTEMSPEESDQIMLVVLPFENLGPTEDEYFADGITDEITSRLSAVRNLGVISRTSARSFKGTTKKLQQIAAELGVEYVLEGSIRWDKSSDTDRVRITPQLIRVSDDTQMWSDRFERPLSEVFAVQSEIAEKVVEALNVSLLYVDQGSFAGEPTTNLEAYDFYLRGKEYLRSARDDQELTLAGEMFEQAIALDPQFALAHAALSQHRSGSYRADMEGSDEILASARTHAEKALSLAPSLPEAHVAMGFYFFRGMSDYEAALKEFSIAREYNPNHSDVLQAMSIVARLQGRWLDAYGDIKRSVVLDPQSWHKRWHYAYICIMMRRFDEANRSLEQSLALFPQNTQLYSLKARAAVMQFADPAMVRDIVRQMVSVPLDSIEYRHIERLAAILEGDYQSLIEHYQDISEIALAAYPPAQREVTRKVRRWMDMADWYHLIGNETASRANYDSALAVLVGSSDDIYLPVRKMGLYIATAPKQASLGLIYAALGRKEEAISESKRLIESLPSADSVVARSEYELILAEIYTRVGEYDRAIDRLEFALSIPGELTAAMLRTRPVWDPLRNHPRFQALIEKYEKEHGI